MPCYEVRLAQVALEAADLALLKAAIEREYGCAVELLGGGTALRFWHPDGYVVTVIGGKVTLPAGREREVDRIKRAYTRAAVEKSAKRLGWTARQTGERKLVVERRW